TIVAVAEPVMETIGSSLPELDGLGDQPPAAPVLGPGHIISKPGVELGEARFKFFPGGNHLTLTGGMGGDPRTSRAGSEVCVGESVADPNHGALEPDLT